MKMFRFVAALTTILLPALVLATTLPDLVNKAQVMNKAYRMQIPFIENKGQLEDSNASFYAKTFGGTVFVVKDGTLTYSFPSHDKSGVVIKEVVTNKKVAVKGLQPSPTKINYFKGKDQNKWKTNIPSYKSVSLGEVYKGVELTLKAYGKNVEKIFKVLPGKDPGEIKVTLEGVKGLEVNEQGELEGVTGAGSIKFTKPIAYQEIDGKRQFIEVTYANKGTNKVPGRLWSKPIL